MEVPAFNPNAPGVILLGQIILDYNNHPTSQTGNQQSDNSEQSQSDEARSASDQMNGGQFNPADFIPPPNCASPKVYYSGPCSYGIPPPGVAQVPPQFVIPQGPPTNLRFGNYVPVPMYPQYNQTINLSNGVSPLQFAGSSVPHGPCTQVPQQQQTPVYPHQYSHPPCMPPKVTQSTTRRPKTAPDIRGDFHDGSNVCYPPPVGIHSSTSGTDLVKTANCCGGDFMRHEQPLDSLEDLETASGLDNFAPESTAQGLTMSSNGVDKPAEESLSESTCCDNPKIFNPNAREFYPTSSAENLSICESDIVHRKLKDAQGCGDDNKVPQVNELEQC